MKELVGDKLAVRFSVTHNQGYDLGNGIILERADAWEHSEGTAEQNKLVTNNVNKIDVNPQICEVVVSNENSFFNVGDKIFTHYMAYEVADPIEIDGEELAIIENDFAIFKIENGKKVLPNGYYLGEQIMETEIKLESGLFLNVIEKKKALTIKITDVPEKASDILVNDVIQSIDDFNYQFPYEGKNYVFIKEEEIVAKLV